MALADIFVGVPQSKYAGLAILVALVAIAVAVLFGKDSVPLSKKFVVILMMFLVALPSILLALFQLTCIVTGAGVKNQRWWCAAYAWLGSALVLLYAVVLVAFAVMSIVYGTNVLEDIAVDGFAVKKTKEAFDEEKKKAEQFAEDMMKPAEEKPKAPEAGEPPVLTPPMPEEKPALLPEIEGAGPETFTSCAGSPY